nr:PREDICTED: F-box only protein 21-like [Linepithema humile]XP_012220292.1 PREDICTED: F-box only protein 21-like [Linepithema humile]
MAAITYLSTEVLNIILCDESISFKDIMSLALTCKQLYNLTNNNMLWRKKFYQRWPYLREEYDKQLCKENFLEQVKAGIKSKKQLRHYMSLMSKEHYYKDDLFDVDLKDLHSLFDPDKGAYFMNYYFFVNELIKLFAQSSTESDLTQRYYAKKLLSYLQHYRLRNMWHKFINYPEQQQILEEAATILAQWYQPQKYVSYMDVRTSLDNIAQQVLEYHKNKYPAHPIFSISPEQFSFWKYNNIDDNHWNSTEGRQIIESLCKVLYDKLGFHGNLEEPLESESKSILEHAFIDCVLKNKIGTAVTLATIYHSVARRLGVRCDLMSFPTHFFLCWRAKYHTTNLKEQKCFYIDVLRDGSMLSRNDCPIISGATKCPIAWFDKYTKISPVEMMSRMSNYLETKNKNDEDKITQRSFLELTCLIEPDTSAINDLGRIYVQHQTDLSNLIVMLEKIQDNCKFTNPVEARRAEQLLNKFRNHVNPVMLE